MRKLVLAEALPETPLACGQRAARIRSSMNVKIPGTEESNQSRDDQVDRDDEIQQARYD
jgi:hypothetical protein